MKYKIINISILIIMLQCFSACKDSDFLDVDSRETVEAGDSQEIFQPETYINGIYGMFSDFNYGFAYLGVTEMLSDNADKGSSPTDPGTDKDLLDNLTYTSATPSFSSLWSHWYKSIGRATQAIEYTENFGLADEGYKNRLIGEAKFLRALNYFFLVRGWGAVPIQDQDLIRRAPVNEVYDYIKQDLLDAIQVLPSKNEYAAKDLGRATRGAAQALLAKVYLYQSDWQNAYAAANEVITSGQYGLESNYDVLWRASSENGIESIFEFQGRGESIAHGIQQYSQTQGARGPGGWGWGFNTPTQDLLNAFNAEGDAIRRDATIIFRGETLYDGRVVDPVENPMYNEKAYSSANAGADDTDKNIRYLRLGEIYLILAEAANELGMTNEALNALNMIRRRVELTELAATDQASLRQAIWKERRLELAFEHDRWFDLVRTRQAGETMRAHGKPFNDGRNYLFPIPNNQLIQTPEMEQNPGW